MKPASVIALIIAAVLIVIGVAVCFTANGMAQKNGNLLFSETRGDDSVTTVKLDDKTTIKISLDVEDADINIYGKSGESYIEFVNFRETFYSLSSTSASVTFREIPDASSLFKFWESGFTFKGIRTFINPQNYDNSKRKVINVYLSDACGIKQFDISADTAAVTLEHLSCQADYVIVANELSLFTNGVKTNSLLKINTGNGASPAEKANLEIKSSSFGSLTLSANELDFAATASHAANVNITAKTGILSWDIASAAVSSTYLADPQISLVTNGALHLNGEEITSPFKHDSIAEEPRVFSIDGGDADIAISGLEMLILDEETAPEQKGN